MSCKSVSVRETILVHIEGIDATLTFPIHKTKKPTQVKPFRQLRTRLFLSSHTHIPTCDKRDCKYPTHKHKLSSSHHYTQPVRATELLLHDSITFELVKENTLG